MTADEDPVTRATFKFTSQLSNYLLSPDNFLNSGTGANGRSAARKWTREGPTEPVWRRIQEILENRAQNRNIRRQL
jgi:hypothetical protein